MLNGDSFKSRYQELKEKRDALAGKARKPRSTNSTWNRSPSHRRRKQASKDGHKICNKCSEEKPLTKFYQNCGTKDGRQNHCKACHKKLNAITNKRRNRNVHA